MPNDFSLVGGVGFVIGIAVGIGGCVLAMYLWYRMEA